ncbi:GFA family protein [Bosea sp. CS1GBMeth4]|uniref:GFA family protein n=1 Tax=Bosea sp. CS1GBMeth4 TaxID=1892849 RepID=UPI0016448181|nr:GFA family protein [Bosea sp. CS1GBMeth4]
MPVTLKGSCRCGRVSFTADSHTPVPYQLCYCSICRKTAGGGGFAINIMADSATLTIEGEDSIGLFHAEIRDEAGRCARSRGERRFCKGCGTALWVYDPAWPELIHPFASAIDSDLPMAAEKTHILLRFKASWVEPVVGPRDRSFDGYPEESIEDWHRRRGLWID